MYTLETKFWRSLGSSGVKSARPGSVTPCTLRVHDGMQVSFGRNSPQSTSSREGSARLGARTSPPDHPQDSGAGLRTTGWVAQQLDFTGAQQRMGQASCPLPAPSQASPLDRRLQDPSLQMGRAPSGQLPPAGRIQQQHQASPAGAQQMVRAQTGQMLAAGGVEGLPAVAQQMGRAYSGQLPEAVVNAQQQQTPWAGSEQAGRARSGQMPTVQGRQGAPGGLEQIGRTHLRAASPDIMQRHLVSERAHSLTRAHSGRSPTPPPVPPRSETARQAYRFIDDSYASSGDDPDFRVRRPSTRPPPPSTSGFADAARVQPEGSRFHGRSQAHDSPAPPPMEPAAQLPYAELIPIMAGGSLARGGPQAGQAPQYAFIDDSSGDDSARRPAPSRQLPAARPTSGWVEQPIPAAARVWQDEEGRWYSSGSGQSQLSRDDGSEAPGQSAATAAGASTQRVTPGAHDLMSHGHCYWSILHATTSACKMLQPWVGCTGMCLHISWTAGCCTSWKCVTFHARHVSARESSRVPSVLQDQHHHGALAFCTFLRLRHV